MNKTYFRGAIYYANLNPVVGSEQGGCRPVLIIQNNIGNKHSPTVIIAPISSKAGIKPKLPTHYFISAGDSLELPSIVLLEQLRTIDKSRLEEYIGKLNEEQMEGVNHALAISTGLRKQMPSKSIMCLCHICADNFYSTNNFIISRVNPYQSQKDTCTYCNIRQGFDFEIIKRN